MKTKQGIITSAAMQNTVTVTVHRYKLHPMYSKRYRMSKKFLADTNDMKDLGIGDEVVIAECRPISKRKHFLVTEVIKRAPRTAQLKEETSIAAPVKEEAKAPEKKEKKTKSSPKKS